MEPSRLLCEKGHPIELCTCKTNKPKLPVDNIVRQLYVVQQICGQTYTDLHPFYEHINDAVKYMNDLKAQMNSKFRVIKRLEFLVA